MISPAKAHMQRKLAEQQAKQDGSTTRPDANQYELMLVQLHEHRLRLKAIQSVQSKIELKAELLPDYVPYIDGVLAAGTGQQDDVLMTVMVWRMDVADWSGALAIAAHAIEHGMTLPDLYKRSTACLIAEEIADAAIKAKGSEAGFDAEVLNRTLALTGDSDMPDQVRAKLHKALGYALEHSDPEKAVWNLRTALTYHDKAGVKKDIERIERAIKNKGTTGTEPEQP